jgi:hypothetical protein
MPPACVPPSCEVFRWVDLLPAEAWVVWGVGVHGLEIDSRDLWFVIRIGNVHVGAVRLRVTNFEPRERMRRGEEHNAER